METWPSTTEQQQQQQKQHQQENFDPQKIVCPKNMGPKKFGSKTILGQSLVKIRRVVAAISYYTETRTDVAGNNVYG